MAKLSLKERYSLLTRDLDWTPTYVDPAEVYPYTRYEGIKIHDWDAWEDPFRLTVDSYCKYQAEKDKKLYAVIDSYAQAQGHLSVTDARYYDALKLFIQAGTPLEYGAHRHFAFLGRYLDGPGPRFAAMCQSIDELRHTQIEVHNFGTFNKYYSGFHNWSKWYDRVWYLSVPKSFFEDAFSSGPFEFMTAVSFSFEYLLTNLLFVPFMSGASFNGDVATMTFGFSAQSDESRHMTLGLESVKFMLEQDEDNVPIVQEWIDKWFWRAYRVLGLVSAMMDYMLPKKVMSWKEAFELYFEQQMLDGLFTDLAFYGIRPPMGVEQAIAEKEYISHQLYWLLYEFCFAACFHATVPPDEELDWMSEQYPMFDQHFRPRLEKARRMEQEGNRYFYRGLPLICQTCQIPMGFSEPGDPATISFRRSEFRGEQYNFCSDPCKWIFDREPEKYCQAWLPPHQVFQGNCGGGTIPEVLAWYGVEDGVDNGEYLTSPDHESWVRWHAPEPLGGGA